MLGGDEMKENCTICKFAELPDKRMEKAFGYLIGGSVICPKIDGDPFEEANNGYTIRTEGDSCAEFKRLD